MTGEIPSAPPIQRRPVEGDDLLLRETSHRCSNDLQLVVSLLALQSRRTANPEVREALADAMERVSVLAHARRALHQDRPATLEAALRQVCTALHAQAEPRSISISLEDGDGVPGLPVNHITTVALVVNELATNAIKHAFEEDKPGHIRVTITGKRGEAVVLVDDDGLPFLEPGGTGLWNGDRQTPHGINWRPLHRPHTRLKAVRAESSSGLVAKPDDRQCCVVMLSII